MKGSWSTDEQVFLPSCTLYLPGQGHYCLKLFNWYSQLELIFIQISKWKTDQTSLPCESKNKLSDFFFFFFFSVKVMSSLANSCWNSNLPRFGSVWDYFFNKIIQTSVYFAHWMWFFFSTWFFPCSKDMEDPVLCGRPSRCSCVHAEHVPEGAEPQPRAAWVCPLLSPSHSQQGLINGIKIQCEPEVPLLIGVLISAAFPMGRRQQIPFPQLSCECSSRWLRGSRRVKHLFSRPLNGTRFPSAFVTGPQIHFLFTLPYWCIYLWPHRGVTRTNPHSSFNKMSSWNE